MKKLILIAMMSAFALNAQANRGAEGGGGGNGVGNQLFDFYENEGTDQFDVVNSNAYKKILILIFAALDQKIPGLSDQLKKGLEGTWYLESKTLSSDRCTNASMINAKKNVIACQNSIEVRLSKSWMQAADLKNQAGLIMHELVRYKSIHSSLNLSDENITFLTRTLMNASKLSDSELQKSLKKGGLGEFETSTDIHFASRYIKNNFYKKYCSTPTIKSVNDMMGEIIGTGRSNMIKASNETERDQWESLAERGMDLSRTTLINDIRKMSGSNPKSDVELAANICNLAISE